MRPLEVVARVRHGFAVGLEELVQLSVGVVGTPFGGETVVVVVVDVDPAARLDSAPASETIRTGTVSVPFSSSSRGAAPARGRCSLASYRRRAEFRLTQIAEGLDVTPDCSRR